MIASPCPRVTESIDTCISGIRTVLMLINELHGQLLLTAPADPVEATAAQGTTEDDAHYDKDDRPGW